MTNLNLPKNCGSSGVSRPVRVFYDVVRVIQQSDRKVYVCGIDNHEITDLRFVTATGLVQTLHHRPAIVILNQYAYYGQS